MSNLVEYKKYDLDAEKASTIESSFAPKIEERRGFEKVYREIINKEISKELASEASDLRKKLVKVRTGIARIHKTEKQYFFQAGKFVDALKNKLTEPVVQMEEKLSEIENYYENLEKERLQKLQNERVEALTPYVEDAQERDLSSMDDDVWNAYFNAKKQAYEDRIKAEKEAEKKRIAEIEKQKKAEEQKELNKTDKAKIDELLSELDAICLKYNFESEKNKDIYSTVKLLVQEAITTIKDRADV